MPVSDFTTADLQRAARAVMRGYLDDETTRDQARLSRYLAPEASNSPRGHEAGEGQRDSPIRHADIGPVTVLRLGPDRAYACAAVPGAESQQRTVIAVELAAEDDRLRVTRVGRAAEEAQRAPAERAPAAVGDGQPPPEPPPHLTALLGGIPTTADARARWLTAAAVIDTYRERYDVHDARSALGPQPTDPHQQAAREHALAYTRDAVERIDRAEPDRQARAATREQPGPELGR